MIFPVAEVREPAAAEGEQQAGEGHFAVSSQRELSIAVLNPIKEMGCN